MGILAGGRDMIGRGQAVADSGAGRKPVGADDLDEAAAIFTGVRPRLFGIAYRMLSSASEAEDLVQEVWLRWQATGRGAVVNPAAFLATTTTRLAMTPNERAAYVLREAFDYPYGQIADILRSTEPAVRQLVSRARRHMAGERRTPVSAAAQRELLTTFIAAARSGDLTALERLLTADATSLSDGNGAARVARRPVVGGVRVARFLTAISTWFWDGMDVGWASTNGQTSAVLRRDGKVYGVITVGASTEGIDQVLWMVNPGKIAAVSAPA